MTPGRVTDALDKGHIVIVAGFQGVSQDTKEITTLGRGGTDTTAVALAAALNADVCEIYTDVDGVFTADPRIVPAARKIHRISNEEMLELAASGSKVLHLRSVEYARRFDIPIHVRSSFSAKEGTIVTDKPAEGDTVEAPIIAGVAHDRSEAKITVVGVPDHPGKAAEIFQTCADAEINIDMIVQNVSATETGLTDISFTCPKTDGQTGVHALRKVQDVGGVRLDPVRRPDRQAVAGRAPGCARTRASRRPSSRRSPTPGVNIEMISTSEIRISVVTRGRRPRRRRARGAHGLRAGLHRGRSRGLRRHRPVTSLASKAPRPTLALVGATGAVGAVTQQVLAMRADIWGEIRAAAAPRTPARCWSSAAARSSSRSCRRSSSTASTSPSSTCPRRWPPSGRPSRRLAARSSSTTARPCAATPTSRWSSPRSTPCRSATGPRASSPTPAPRR